MGSSPLSLPSPANPGSTRDPWISWGGKGEEERLRVAAVGLGWVTTNRHLPWLLRDRRVSVAGVIDPHRERVDRVAARHRVRHVAVTADPGEVPWLSQVDAVTVGTPPRTHASLARSFLDAGKHVLLEKPFAVSPGEAADLEEAARRAGRVLAVVHNFQFSRSITRLRRLVAEGALGELRSIWGVQLSNPRRRLPAWYEDLPLGLFYDESPHLLYLVRCLSPTEPVADQARILRSRGGHATPHQVDLAMHAADVSVRISIDFEAPVSEWQLAVLGSRRLAVVDLFRDVLVVVGNDGLHRGREIVGTSWAALRTHLLGVAASGSLLLRGRLSYGNDEVIRRFVGACLEGGTPDGIAAADGRRVTALQHWVIARCSEDPAREQLLPS